MNKEKKHWNQVQYTTATNGIIRHTMVNNIQQQPSHNSSVNTCNFDIRRSAAAACGSSTTASRISSIIRMNNIFSFRFEAVYKKQKNRGGEGKSKKVMDNVHTEVEPNGKKTKNLT